MTSTRWFVVAAMVSGASFLGGCGGNVAVGTGGSGANGGNGGTGGGGGDTGGGSSSVSVGGGSSSSSSVGGGTTTTSSMSAGGSGGGECAGLGHVACVRAFPDCVPVYDDECCPDCDPMGGCADCINIQFHHCEAASVPCEAEPAKPTVCGQIPKWACSGGQAECDIPVGGPEPCASVAGCMPISCPANADCNLACAPVNGDMCTAVCASVPPQCDPGWVPEGDGGCWTGNCIPAEACQLAP